MNYFIDIRIKADAEMRENVLLNKIYTELHKTLFTLHSTKIGISFPNYKTLLGDVIRIHGSEGKLKELQTTGWLGRLEGYCDVSIVQTIPDDVKYRTISRKQANMTEAKLRRLIKRGSISAEEVKGYKAKMFQKGLDNAFLEMDSRSNGHKHRRYLSFGDLQNIPVEGNFDRFGLSKTATVPWF